MWKTASQSIFIINVWLKQKYSVSVDAIVVIRCFYVSKNIFISVLLNTLFFLLAFHLPIPYLAGSRHKGDLGAHSWISNV